MTHDQGVRRHVSVHQPLYALFEYFWDSTHKAIFFAILALSFWYLGSRAEKIWNLGGLTRKDGTTARHDKV